MSAEAEKAEREFGERSARLAVEHERQAGYAKRLQELPVPLEEALSRFFPSKADSDAVRRADELFRQRSDAYRAASAPEANRPAPQATRHSLVAHAAEP